MRKYTREMAIGLAGIVAIAVLYYGISFLKGMNLFSSSNVYYATFEDAQGLTQSSPVYADGYAIGIVNDIAYDYNHPKHVTVSLSLDKDMRIPAGSTVEIEKEMLGTIKLHLLLANNPSQRVEPGDTIPGAPMQGLVATATELVPQFQALIPMLDSILVSVNTLLRDESLHNILHNADMMTANLDATTAKLNRLLDRDLPRLSNSLNALSLSADTMVVDIDRKVNQLDVEGLMTRVNSTLDNVQTLTDKLNSKDNSVGLLLNDPTLYNNLTETSANAAALLGDLKAHPKRYVHFSLFGKKDK